MMRRALAGQQQPRRHLRRNGKTSRCKQARLRQERQRSDLSGSLRANPHQQEWLVPWQPYHGWLIRPRQVDHPAYLAWVEGRGVIADE